MLPRLLLLLLIVGLFFWLKQRYKSLSMAQRKKWLLKIAAGAVIGLLLLGVVTGRMHWIGAVFAALIGVAKLGRGWFSRYLPSLMQLLGLTLFSNPVFSTPYLKAEVRLGDKHMTGSVLQGPHKGKKLSDLTDEELLELERYYNTHDKRSCFLIKTYRQLKAGQTGSEGSFDSSQRISDPSYDEALQILGLEQYIGKHQPDRELVIKAHRRLMQKLHPDRGGNDYLAACVNRAKETVLKKNT